jgi:hypothetical protein
MNKLKVLLGSSVASFALVAGLALPAAAQSVDASVTTDNSTNVSVTGDCSAAFVGDNNQTQVNDTAQGNIDVDLGVNLGGNLGSGSNDQANNQGGSQSNTNSTTQTQTGNSFNADCSTTNVTNVTKTVATEKAPVVAQVTSAPQGGVHAGFGSTATKSSSAVALVGLTGSLSVVGLGLRFLKGEL